MPDLIAKPLLVAALVGAVALAGCINAPGASKDKDPEPLVNPTGGNGTGTIPGGNQTGNLTDRKPPVARMQVFNGTGALVYESDFVAADTAAKAPVEGGLPLRFVGSASEAVDKTATVSAWDWDFGDGGRASGRSVEHTFTDLGGVFNVTLRVRDSHGLADALRVTLGALATRTYNQSYAFTGFASPVTLGLPLGLVSEDLDGLDVAGIRTATHDFDVVADIEGLPVAFRGGLITITPVDPLLPLGTFNLLLRDAGGNITARSPTPPLSVAGLVDLPLPNIGAPNAIDLTNVVLVSGTYTIEVRYELGVLGGYTLDAVLDYSTTNAAVDAMFGEGHAH